jgi:PhoPQ-activated pathogenicity-related protein
LDLDAARRTSHHLKRTGTRNKALVVPALVFSLLLPACVERTESADDSQRSESTAPDRTALDRYVVADDPNYAYEHVRTLEGEGWAAHVLKMTSQTWLGPDEVDPTLWWHWLTVIVPETVTSDVGMLYLTGGRNTDAPPEEPDSDRLRYALATRTVVADLHQVPNQPLTFADGDEPLRESKLIAYAWDRYLRGGDATWLPRLPMTKSAVRAMDTVTSFCAGADGGGVDVARFVVAGRSKRGWTAWTTAAVDDRVVGIVPMIIDLLNMEKSFTHHYEAYGAWSPVIDDYVNKGIPDWFGTERLASLAAIVEPFSYRSRFTMPKLLINATGDLFFLPDSSRFYFDDLPPEKHLRYLPNSGHSIGGTDALDTLLAFYWAIVNDAPRPAFSWTFQSDGSIRVRSAGTIEPERILLWQATNPEARDFRIDKIGEAWTSTSLLPEDDGSIVARVEQPVSGWTAFFVELTFPSGGPAPFKFTTDVRVLPDALPHGLGPN